MNINFDYPFFDRTDAAYYHIKTYGGFSGTTQYLTSYNSNNTLLKVNTPPHGCGQI